MIAITEYSRHQRHLLVCIGLAASLFCSIGLKANELSSASVQRALEQLRPDGIPVRSVDRDRLVASLDEIQTAGAEVGWNADFVHNSAPDHDVRAAAVWDDGTGEALYVGGNFSTAGGTRVNKIARWNGTAWVPLGTGLSREDGGFASVAVLSVIDGALVVGGNFTSAGGVPARNVAKWDGSEWSGFGSGINPVEVRALAKYDGEIYAAGVFQANGHLQTVRHIAVWDGATCPGLPQVPACWRAVSPPLFFHTFDSVLALQVYRDRLIVAGQLRSVGSMAISNIVAWDGKEWSELGSGIAGTVRSLTVINNELVAGGSFVQAGGVSALGIARWDGEAWSDMAQGLTLGAWVEALASNGAELFAAGNIRIAGTSAPENIVKWDGGAWVGAAGGLDGFVQSLAFMGNSLAAGGQFASADAGNVLVNNIAMLDEDSQWQALGLGLNGIINALGEYDNELIAGGHFALAGDAAAQKVARWNGERWAGLGAGITVANTIPPRINGLAVFEGNLVVGGSFRRAGHVLASDIAQWDGTDWSALGGGVNSSVNALFADGNSLVVGGILSVNVNGTVSRGIARWNGQWSGFGTGVSGNSRSVKAIASHLGDIVAGGDFTSANGVPASQVARWDGSNWSAMGAGIQGQVYALAEHAGNLYAGGSFLTSGGTPLNSIARWDDPNWSGLEGGVSFGDSVNALVVHQGHLVAGGEFTTAGEVPARSIARWDGSGWAAFGEGLDGEVRALAVFQDQLVAGGTFSKAGRIDSPFIASWGPSWSTSMSIEVDAFTPVGLPVTLTAWVSGDVAPAVGFVSFVGAPGGSCSSIQLVPQDATVSTASCEITYHTEGAKTIRGWYSGGVGFQPSSAESVLLHVGVLPDLVFASGFE